MNTQKRHLHFRWALLVVGALTLLAPINTAKAFNPDRDAKNSIFFEFGGPGLFYSINYERLIWGGLGARVGFSYLQLKVTDEFEGISGDARAFFWSIPVVFEYLGISTGKHTLELGIGFTVLKVGGDLDIESIDILNVVGRDTVGSYTIGYRIQKPNGGFQFRIGYSPFFGKLPVIGSFYQHWAYLSLGGAF